MRRFLKVNMTPSDELFKLTPRISNLYLLGSLLKTALYYIFQDQTVRYNALIAVQKMMVNNWEILGRQITAN